MCWHLGCFMDIEGLFIVHSTLACCRSPYRSVKAQLRVGHSLGYLFQHLVSELPQRVTHVRHLLLDDLLQQRRQFGQGRVVHVVEPALDEYTVVRLQLEVLRDIIDDDGL